MSSRKTKRAVPVRQTTSKVECQAISSRMPTDFAVFILTNGRPDRVYTATEIRRAGYTGRIIIIVDDEDKTVNDYCQRFGAENVSIFSKIQIAERFDEGDNFNDRRSIFYARNACFDIAKRLGIKHFVQLDDDYFAFFYRWASDRRYGCWRIRNTMDDCLLAMLQYFQEIPASSIAMSQGGDHIGGGGSKSGRGKDIFARRKCMNSFICSTERRFDFIGRINEDVNTYTTNSRLGSLFLTIMPIQLIQVTTQANTGGMTELYIESGTYVKSFYSVMYAPSCVKIGELMDPLNPHPRIHHVVDWKRAAPCILREEYRRTE